MSERSTAKPDAYDLLAPFGVAPDSSMAEIHRAALNAQRQGHLEPELSQAWRDLRNPQKRLLIDVFRFQHDPALYGTAAGEQIDFWQLLEEIVEEPDDILESLPAPESFLEELL